ncbi:PREDICTED: uncharacterized protein K02A2.6-like [Wasmannia auropunctata]|uniref:uncharacterized protein K02A2.6-like n=1 Tax=Wasmannia auropunctata TaxID=64793 RepID=UPI0005EF71DB|nr:PREDICTED: uncharacterized protein K02A2.6-like [Wasmannia auropunctata]
MSLDKCRKLHHDGINQCAVNKNNKVLDSPTDPQSNQVFRNQIVNEFPKLFSPGLGQCKNFQAKFTLSENAVPKQTSCRQIPYAMEKSLEKEISRLESLDIIERVHLSDWSTPIVIVKKPDGKIRLCADYSTGVNNALRGNSYPLPNIDLIMSKLNGNSYFSVLDLSDAFLQIEVAKDHRDVTAITTPKGLYRFKRLPFGIKTAPTIFQQAMNFTLSGLDGVYAYIDNVVVMGSTRQEHDSCLRKTLHRLEEIGWKLKPEKCRLALREIKYLGAIINGSGISADPEATRAVAKLPKTSCVAEVQSFLGMINHYGKFIPHLHQIKKPLEDLTRKNQPWAWNSHHDAAFLRVKKILLSPLLLEHFDPSKTLVVAADACSTGIGNLEKEAIALVTAIERFHKFLWGREFILQTDHKPLVALLQTENTKGLKPTTAARLKRWAIRLLRYDFKIEYVSTQDFGQADALSRLIEKFRQDNSEELQVAGIHAVDNEIQQIRDLSIDKFGKDFRHKLKTATGLDPDLKTVMKAIQDNKFPIACSPIVEHYKKRADCLTIVDDTLLLGDRVVIPQSMQSSILSSLHKGHPGIRRMKQLACEYVYWPKLSEDIEHLVKRCDPCALTRKFPVKVPISPWPIPSRPLERLHLDFAGPIDGKYLLIFVDAYSKFIDVGITSTISAARTV